MSRPTCPECAQGKPQNCTGWALDDQDREVECATSGCECTELCEMGPTCPGGMLARLPGAGCWRTAARDEATDRG